VAAAGGNLRVLTWNIHRGIGSHGLYDLVPIAHLVAQHDPDIIALQEVDSRGYENTSGAPIKLLAESLGEHVAEARTIAAPDGHYGHVLISRWPLLPPKLHDISVPHREPRCVIETVAKTPAGPVHLAAVHLGLQIRERRQQASRLADIARSAAPISIMLGDFNDWPWRGVVRRTLAHALPGRTRLKTYPSWLPMLMLDRIYCRPAEALLRSWTDHRGRRFSDHLPVIGDIAIGAR